MKFKEALIILVCYFVQVIAIAQTPILIFRSGFEATTDTTPQGSSSTDIIGVDNSVAPPNDWVNDLEANPSIGNFSIQYEGGNDTMRLAEIVADPANSSNKALRFWIKHPNVDGIKGRIQGNVYENTGITNLYYSIRLYLPTDFNLLKTVPVEIKWLTLMEFWNNPGWLGNSYPFRVTVNLQKLGNAADSLRLGAHGQTYSESLSDWIDVWDTTNTSFVVPVGRWMTIKIHYIEGNASAGRFQLSVIVAGDPSETNVLDITNYTHHPSDPSPDGLSHFNPFKLYTGDGIINTLTSWGKLLNVYWDDFELWKDSSITTGNTVINSNDKKTEVFVHPNPFIDQTNLRFANPNSEACTLILFDYLGRPVHIVKNILTGHVEIKRNELVSGLYFFQLRTKKGTAAVGKLAIE